jgi:pSer/pThr/pTyr-binding forkhead associated (FHA) protein
MISNELTPGTAALHVKDSYGADIECELKPDQGVFVGRSSNCGLKLRGEGLSDIHCRVGLEGGKLWIQDWMSASGTRVNGQQIATKTEIRNGDVVGVGPNEVTVLTGDMSDAPTNTAPTSTETTNTLSTSNLLTSAIDDISNQIDDCVAISPDQDEQRDDQPDHSNLLSAFQE